MSQISERDSAIYKEWLAGTPAKELASRYALAPARVSQICKHVKWRLSLPPESLDGLSTRARNGIFNYFGRVATKEEVAQIRAIDFFRIPNFGRETIREVRRWLMEDGFDLRDPLENLGPDPQTIARYTAYLTRHGYKVTPPTPTAPKRTPPRLGKARQRE